MQNRVIFFSTLAVSVVAIIALRLYWKPSVDFTPWIMLVMLGSLITTNFCQAKEIQRLRKELEEKSKK